MFFIIFSRLWMSWVSNFLLIDEVLMTFEWVTIEVFEDRDIERIEGKFWISG